MTIWELIANCWPPYLPSTEGKQVYASKSEMRRWFERNSVHVDGKPVSMNIEINETMSIVLHPNGKRRTTLQ